MKKSQLHKYADQAALWRQRAEKLRALARATPQARAKAELLDLARQWEGMAQRAETRRAPGPAE